MITTVAGNFIGFNQINPTPYAGDGGPAKAAHLNVPYATSVDSDGDLIIADAGNHAVREIISATGIIATLAGRGPGWVGYSGDGSAAENALMWNPQSAASDAAGNLYIADSQNNAIRMILRSNGWITTIAGLGPEKPGYSGDNGPATAAKLDSPQGVAIDSDGNIYISDNGNHVIRKITGGIISTIAGTGSTGYSGDGGPALSATFSTLKGLATDKQNNLYIADASNNVIRMIDRTGNIYTVAGDGIAGYSGDGGVANKARLSNPLSIAIDNQNNLYIADTNNSAIRKVTW
jgi:sugar lactone lactonase YvrE